jgi:hypothetical protein
VKPGLTCVLRLRLFAGAVRLNPNAPSAAVTLARGRTRYATGMSQSLGHGRLLLVLVSLRPLTRGQYRLTLVTHRGHRSITRRVRAAIS